MSVVSLGWRRAAVAGLIAAFGVKQGDALYIAPENQVKIG